MTALRFLARMLVPELRWMALGVALGLATAMAVVGLMVVSGQLLALAVVVGAAHPHGWAPALSRLNAGIRFFAVTRTLGRYGDRLYSHEATFRILARLRVWFFQELAPLAPARLGAHRSGDLLERIVGDIDALAAFYSKLAAPFFVALGLVVATEALLASFHPRLAWSALGPLLLAALALPAAAFWLGRSAGRAISDAARRLRVDWTDVVTSLPEITVFGASASRRERLDAGADVLLDAQRRRERAGAILEVAGRLIAGLGLVFVLRTGIELVRAGEVRPLHLAALTLATTMSLELLAPLAQAFLDLPRAQRAARRLQEVLEASPPPPSGAPATRRPADAALGFEGVSFRYDEGASMVLREVDLTIPSGAKVALLGSTGSGKSTLASLILRFWEPTAGKITLGGVDIRELPESDLRRLVSAVPQRPHLFAGTVADNLRLGRPEASDDELRDVLLRVGLDEVVESFERGLETWVGEGGVRLSGGQTRRLAIARALLRDAPILLLDEPTEDLDADAAARLREVLLDEAKERTTLFITHRSSGLDAFDLVVLLEMGRVVEVVAPSQLRSRGARFLNLCFP